MNSSRHKPAMPTSDVTVGSPGQLPRRTATHCAVGPPPHIESAAPPAPCTAGWCEEIKLLGQGHYMRFDESTAEQLRALCKKLGHQACRLSLMRRTGEDR
jgi:hypothetical protein